MVHSSGRASVPQECDQNLSRIWPFPLMEVCIFPMGCASLCYSLVLLPCFFCPHRAHAVLVFISKCKCAPLSKFPGHGMFYASLLAALQCWSEITRCLDFLAVKPNILRNGKFYWNPAALARVWEGPHSRFHARVVAMDVQNYLTWIYSFFRVFFGGVWLGFFVYQGGANAL